MKTNWRFSQKPMLRSNFFAKTSSSLRKKYQYFRQIFRRKKFKKSVPVIVNGDNGSPQFRRGGLVPRGVAPPDQRRGVLQKKFDTFAMTEQILTFAPRCKL
jgi:hypothetical protein